MKNVVIGTLVVGLVAASPAYADRTGDVVGSIIGGVIVGKMLSDHEHDRNRIAVQPVIVQQPAPVIVTQPVQCVTPMSDSWGNVRYYVVPCPPYVR